MTSSLLKTVLILILCCYVGQCSCPGNNQIQCTNSDKCIDMNYVCDGDNDCGNRDDEDPALCKIWLGSGCGKNEAYCSRLEQNQCVTKATYCTTSLPPCTGKLDRRICSMIRNKKLAQVLDPVHDLEGKSNLEVSEHIGKEFLGVVNTTIYHPRCPKMFTKVADSCLSIFFFGNVSWGEARAICKFLDGDLISFHNIELYMDVLQHLEDHKLPFDFWVGGYYNSSSFEWEWVNDYQMDLGAPYWTLRYDGYCYERPPSRILNKRYSVNRGGCSHYFLAPDSLGLDGQCAAIKYENNFYISDEDCQDKRSPLCITVPNQIESEDLDP